MLRNITFTIDDARFPLVTLSVSYDSDQFGRKIIGPVKIAYDLAYVKAEEMLHNALRPVVEDAVKSGKSKRTKEGQTNG